VAIELVPPADDPDAEDVVARAARDAGVPLDRAASVPGAWWRAGLVDAVEPLPLRPSASARSGSYDAAPSPRSTRGATRA
jgi:hypothetical protein